MIDLPFKRECISLGLILLRLSADHVEFRGKPGKMTSPYELERLLLQTDTLPQQIQLTLSSTKLDVIPANLSRHPYTNFILSFFRCLEGCISSLNLFPQSSDEVEFSKRVDVRNTSDNAGWIGPR